MDQLGRLQTNALIDQGADPHAGVRLRGEFEAAGLTNVTAGVIGGEWCDANDRWNLSEWQILQRDLNGSLPEERFAEFAEIDKKSRSNGSRILFIPTFYAAGFKP